MTIALRLSTQLCASIIAALCLANPVMAQTGSGPVGDLNYNPSTGNFTPVQEPDGGWQALADLLQKAAPSVDTAVPLTAAQFAAHVSKLIDNGRAQEALELINLRLESLDRLRAIGTDVQLQYQKGRAQAALGDHEQARNTWLAMTTNYPELPEPWNALAIEYVRQGQLQMARQALEQALVSDQNFAPALENLGYVQMQLAQQSFAQARAAAGKKTQQPD